MRLGRTDTALVLNCDVFKTQFVRHTERVSDDLSATRQLAER